MILGLMYSVQTVLFKAYINAHYYFYRCFSSTLREKMNVVLPIDETGVNTSEEDRVEQQMPGYVNNRRTGYFKYMFGRYLFAIKYVKNRSVLDCGCGLGWGSYLISSNTKSVLAIDVNNNALDFSREHWKEDNLQFKKQSVLKLDELDEKYGAILGYELIEHLTLDDGARFLNQSYKSLDKNGVLILSSSFPLRQEKARLSEQRNKYHLHVYTKQEISDLLANIGFSKIKHINKLMIVAYR